ncbi:MAG: hypothetical protein GX552_00700 [Chloroflexi bacterium]|jgi:hypothetical protein|nr:hypothetical protein [Chloroflexota bacterium]
MAYPFVKGGTYRNRRGEYQVIELVGDKMLIRYADGTVQQSSASLQARILQNMQAEQRARTITARPAQTGRARVVAREYDFAGLQDSDFKRGVSGTSWRARGSLGGALAERLSALTQREFQSFAIYRRAEVHLAESAHSSQEEAIHEAKFFLELDSQQALYGFYIEKSDKPMDETWQWLTFVAALRDASLQRQIEAAMSRYDLQWRLLADWAVEPHTIVTLQDGDLVWQAADEAESRRITWREFAANLEAMEEDEWCNLYLCATLDKEEAIAQGVRLVEEVVEVYRALLPLYDASTERN